MSDKEDKFPLPLEDEGAVEWVSEFPYLGFVVAQDARSHIEVNKRIVNASKAFGALRKAVFKDKHLTVATKRRIYIACVFSVLLSVLGVTQERPESAQLPSQLCAHCVGNH